MFKCLLPVIFAALITSPTQACQLFFEAEPTVGLPGYQTVTAYWQTRGFDEFRGFHATFTGRLNQVTPFGLPTPFTDHNDQFSDPAVNADVSQDTQFLFSSTDVLSIGITESETTLTGAISGLRQLGLSNPTPFAQLVTNDARNVQVFLEVDSICDDQWTGTLSDYGIIPEPTTACLVGVAAVVAVLRRRAS